MHSRTEQMRETVNDGIDRDSDAYKLGANMRAVAALANVLSAIDHTLTVHGHIDADTPLHGRIRRALESANDLLVAP